MKENRTNFKSPFRWLLIVFSFLLLQSIQAQNTQFPYMYQYPFGLYPENDAMTMADKVKAQFNAWEKEYYKDSTIDGISYARIKFIQVGEDGFATTSEGIGWGMLIYVYMHNDENSTQKQFDALWNYYKRYKNANGLLPSKIDGFKLGTEAILDPNSLTSANSDAATALLMAYKQWGEERYLDEAKQLINNIWNYQIDHSTKTPLALDVAGFNELISPSSFTTANFQLFQFVAEQFPEKFTDLDWTEVINRSYDIIESTANNETGLTPEWVWNQTPSYPYITGIVEYDPTPYDPYFHSNFQYSAAQTLLRMSHAYAWFGHEEAKATNAKITDWAIENYGSFGAKHIRDGYELDGHEIGTNTNAYFTGAFSSAAMTAATNNADAISFLTAGFNQTDASENGSFYNHTFQLLNMLLMSGNMPNLYSLGHFITEADIYYDEENSEYMALVSLSQKVDTKSISAKGWEVYNGEEKKAITIKDATIYDAKTIKLSFAETIDDAPTIISYNGTGILTDLNSGAPFEEMEAFTATQHNKCNCAELLNISASHKGDKVYLSFDKEINPATFKVAHEYFELKVDGLVYPFEKIELSETDSKTIVLTIANSDQYYNRVNASQEVTLSMTEEVIIAEDFTRAKPFTDQDVAVLTCPCGCPVNIVTGSTDVTVSTDLINSSDEFSLSADNPTGPSDDLNSNIEVMYFKRNSTDGTVSSPAFIQSETASRTFINAIKTSDKPYLLAKLFLPNKEDLGKDIEFVFFNKTNSNDANIYSSINKNFKASYTINEAHKWIVAKIDLSHYKNTSIEADAFRIYLAPQSAEAFEVYFDDIRICDAEEEPTISEAKTDLSGKYVFADFDGRINPNAELKGFSLRSDGFSYTIKSITADQFNSNQLRIEIEETLPLYSDIHLDYSGTSVTLVDGRAIEEFNDFPVTNLSGKEILTYWSYEFTNCKDDLDTEGIMGISGITEPICPGSEEAELYNGHVTIRGFENISLAEWNISPDAKVLDLSQSPTVQITFTNTETIHIRCQAIDINDRITDQVETVTFEPGTHTHTFIFEPQNLLNNGSENPGIVDISMISHIAFTKWHEETAGEGTPIYVDAITIGKEVTLSEIPALIEQGTPLTAQSNQDGYILLLSKTHVEKSIGYFNPHAPATDILKQISAGYGEKVVCSANQPVEISTEELSGEYYIYAYDSETGIVSAPEKTLISDQTKPIILDATTGLKIYQGSIHAQANEDAYFYIVDTDSEFDQNSAEEVIQHAVNIPTIYASAEEWMSFELVKANGIDIQGSYQIYAIDKSNNVSLPSDTIIVTTLCCGPGVTIITDPYYNIGQTITIESDRDVYVTIEEIGGDGTNVLGEKILLKGEVATEVELFEQTEDGNGNTIGFKDMTEYRITSTEVGTGKVMTNDFLVGTISVPFNLSLPAEITILEFHETDIAIHHNGDMIDETLEKISFTIEDESIVSLKESDYDTYFTIYGESAGETTITVEYETTKGNSFSKIIDVYVDYYSPYRPYLEVYNAPTSIHVGESFELNYEILPRDEHSQEVIISIIDGEENISLDGSTFTATQAGDATIRIVSAIDNVLYEDIYIKILPAKDITSPTLTVSPLIVPKGNDIVFEANEEADFYILYAEKMPAEVTPENIRKYAINTVDLHSKADEEEKIASLTSHGFQKYGAYLMYAIDASDNVSLPSDTIRVVTCCTNPIEIITKPPFHLGDTIEAFIAGNSLVSIYTVDNPEKNVLAEQIVSTSGENVKIPLTAALTGEEDPTGFFANTAYEIHAVDTSTNYHTYGWFTIGAINPSPHTMRILPMGASIMLGEIEEFYVSATWAYEAFDKIERLDITSTDESVLNILSNSANRFTAVGKETGQTTLTVTATTYWGSIITETVTVNVYDESNPAKVELAVENNPVMVGSTFYIHSEVMRESGDLDPNQNVTFTSDSDIVVYNETTGKFSAEKEGTAIITATTENGEVSETIEIEVKPAIYFVEGVVLHDGDALVQPYGSIDLSSYASIIPANLEGVELKWEVDGGGTIDENGVFTSNGKYGNYTVTVFVQETNFSQKIDIQIEKEFPVEWISFSTNELELYVGETKTVYAEIGEYDNQHYVEFISEDNYFLYEQEFNVEQNHFIITITGIAAGSQDLHARSHSPSFVRDEISITVIDTTTHPKLTSITIHEELNVLVGESITVTSVTAPENHQPADITYSIIDGAFYGVIDPETGLLETNPDIGENKTVKVQAKAVVNGETIYSNVCMVNIIFEFGREFNDLYFDQSPSELTGLIFEDQVQLTYTISPEGYIPESVLFESSDPDYLEVDPTTGVITVIQQPSELEGERTVYVTLTIDKVHQTSIEVTIGRVYEPIRLESIIIIPETINLLVGEKIATPIYRVIPANATNKEVTISSSDEEVCVLEDDNLLAMKEGTAVIRYTAHNGIFAECTVTVSKPEELHLTARAVQITNNEPYTFNMLDLIDGEYSDTESITWKVEDATNFTTLLKGNELIIVLNDNDKSVEEPIYVAAYNSNGKLASSSITISYTAEQGQVTGIEDENKYKLYPQPVADKLYIETQNNEETEIIIYSITNKVVISQSLFNKGSIDMSNVPSGSYFVKIKTINASIIKPIIKE